MMYWSTTQQYDFPMRLEISWDDVLVDNPTICEYIWYTFFAIAISQLPFRSYPLVNIQKTSKNGKIHYFYGHGFNSELSRWVSRRFPSSQMVTVLTAPMCSSYSWGYILWVTWATHGHIYHHPEVDQLWHKDLFWHEVDLSSSRILFWHGGEYGIFTHIPRLHSFFFWIEKGFIYKRMTIHLREFLSWLL